MLHAESVQGRFGAAHADLAAIRPSSSEGGHAFSSLFSEVRTEVLEFIEHGSAGSNASALSVEGQFHRASVQTAAAATSSDDVNADVSGRQAFLASVMPWAREAAARLGVSPDIITAHAALESGWGRRSLRHPDGRDTHNLFGIKAGGNWQGEAADARTTEYENGVALSTTERFRSFPDLASAFRDFSRLLLENPRYRSALNTGNDVRAYAQGLVRGGYATDPAYADKLARVAARVQSGE